jgi:adenine-specific DNA-methyltransferase
VPETVEWQDNESTLIAPFHYRGLTPEEEGQLSGTQEAKLRESVIQRTTETLRGLSAVTNVQHLATALMAPKKDGSGQVKTDPKTKEPVPLLVHHLNRWSVKNEADFFIHKNLRRFLSGELDYFLKSVVFNIDNVLAAGEPRIDSNFRLLDAVHRLGREIIDFVSQLEDFQKALFEKKKFVLETHYCVTVDQIPQRLYDAILRNEAQVQEWRRLFAIDEIERDTTRPAFTDPLTAEFLSANPSLVVDTKFFDAAFKDDLVASFSDLDQLLGGQLIWADNFQALNLLAACYHEAIDGIYIDPPYNTDASAIAYKNNYKDSSWLALIGSRLELARRVLTPTGIICVAIDDEEAAELNSLLRVNFEKRLGVAVVRSNPAGRKTKGKLAPAHEYAFFFGKSATSTPGSLEVTAKRLARYPLEDEKGRYAWANFIRSGSGDKREDRPTMYYPIYVSSNDKIRIPKLLWDESEEEYNVLEPPKKTEKVVYPIVEDIEKRWQRGFERVEGELEDYRIRRSADGTITIDFKTRMDDEALPITWWDQKEYASANYGAAELKDLFGKKVFDFAKARRLVEDCLLVAGADNGGTFLDFFGGSGTTADAIIQLNRENGLKRRYLVTEAERYFETVLKPRIQKVIYSKDWKRGKPISREGSSHLLKYIQLESYEDCLDNISFDPTTIGDALGLDFQRDFELRYSLDWESKDCPTRLAVEHLNTPFDYTLTLRRETGTVSVKPDLPETFAYLLGLHTRRRFHTQRDGVSYLIYTGTVHEDGTEVVALWRTCKDWTERDLKAEEEWWLERRETLAPGATRIYVNGASAIDGHVSLDAEFKSRMLGDFSN